MADPIQLAIIGAGIYANSTHLPALKMHADRFQVVAVYSRTAPKAEVLAREFSAEATTDLDYLLGRDDIDAFDVLLPIPIMPSVVARVLHTGKHLLSEKPIAADLATARQLLDIRRPQQVWLVGEQWRYEDAFLQAQAMIGELGDLVMVQCSIFNALNPDNHYYHTPWRRSGDFPGGAIVDGGVHRIAALRMLLGEVTHVSAVVKQMREDLPPADTIAATLQFANGALGSYCATYAAGAWIKFPIIITGSQGTMRVSREVLEITKNGETKMYPVTAYLGTHREFAAFADAIQSGQQHRNTPEEAWRDLAVIEAMLQSAKSIEQVAVKCL